MTRPRYRPRLFASLVLAGCMSSGDAKPATRADSPSVAIASAAAPAVMDSALAASLERFRDGLTRTDTLRDALPSKDSVVRHFASLLERNDTTALARLHVSRGEWAWLVYPESRYTHAPYRQQPDIGWMLVIERSNIALGRLLARRGGQSMRVTGWQCDESADVEGRNRYWGGCTVTYRSASGDVVTERLFSSILERDGRYKIGSYSNQF